MKKNNSYDKIYLSCVLIVSASITYQCLELPSGFKGEMYPKILKYGQEINQLNAEITKLKNDFWKHKHYYSDDHVIIRGVTK